MHPRTIHRASARRCVACARQLLGALLRRLRVLLGGLRLGGGLLLGLAQMLIGLGARVRPRALDLLVGGAAGFGDALVDGPGRLLLDAIDVRGRAR